MNCDIFLVSHTKIMLRRIIDLSIKEKGIKIWFEYTPH